MRLALPAPRLNHALAGAALLLAALAAYPWLMPLPAAGGPRPPPPSAMPAAIAGLPPLADFAAVFERPLFSPSRRPAASEAPPQIDSSLPSRYRLLGLVRTSGLRSAVIADGKRHFAVGEGAVLDGWTVSQIAQDHVVLTSPHGQAVLRLRPPSVAADPQPGAKPAR